MKMVTVNVPTLLQQKLFGTPITVLHDQVPAHQLTRIEEPARQTSAKWCPRCGYWFEAVSHA